MSESLLTSQFLGEITPDAWVTSIGTLVGAFLGAFFAGIFTIYSVNRKLKYDNYQKKLEEITTHLKLSTDFISSVNPIITMGNELESFISNDDMKKGVFQEKTIRLAEELNVGSRECDKEIGFFNFYLVPYEHYGHYMITKSTLEILSSDIALLLQDLKRPLKTDYIYFSKSYDNFIELLRDLEKNVIALKGIRQKSENQRDEIMKKI